MRIEYRQPSLTGPRSGGLQSTLRNAVALVGGSILLAAAFMASVAIVVTVGAIAVGVLWWKTRRMRRALREAGVQQSQDGHVIEGTAVREYERP